MKNWEWLWEFEAFQWEYPRFRSRNTASNCSSQFQNVKTPWSLHGDGAERRIFGILRAQISVLIALRNRFVLEGCDRTLLVLASTLEIGYSDTVYPSKNCHYNRLFLYQIILIGTLSNQVQNQNWDSSMMSVLRLNPMFSDICNVV